MAASRAKRNKGVKVKKKGPVGRRQDKFGDRVNVSGGKYVPYKSSPHLFAEVKTVRLTKVEVEGDLASGKVLLRWTENRHLERVAMEPSIGSLVSVGGGGVAGGVLM